MKKVKTTDKNSHNGICKRITFNNKGGGTFLYYSRPINKNDFKRYGKFLQIESNGFSIKLNGRQINSIKNALKNVGEIGGKINKAKCRCNIW